MTTASVATTASSADPDGLAGDAADSGTPTAGKIGMWTFLVIDAMGFGGLLLAYAVLRTRAERWPNPMERLSIPLAAAMTFALVTSSLTVTLALAAIRQGRRAGARVWLGITIVSGSLFLAGQAFEYRQLMTGPQRLGLTTDLFASSFYVITGFHGLHVLAGIVCLGAMLVVGARGRAAASHFEIAALFWHFVDFAWVAIFTFLYLLPTV